MSLFVESTHDDFWGSGLNYEGTVHTDKAKWTGQNNLGKIICSIADDLRPDPEGWRPAKTSKHDEKKKDKTKCDKQSKLSDYDITELVRELKTPRKRLACGRRKSMSAGNSRASSPDKEAG